MSSPENPQGSPEHPEPVSVILAEPRKLLRSALRHAASTTPDLTLLAAVGDGLAAVTTAAELAPDVAVLSSDLPVMDGIEATALLRQRCPRTRVLVLSRDDSAETMLAALRAGADGYLLDDIDLPELRRMLLALARGHHVVSPELVGHLIGHFQQEGMSEQIISPEKGPDALSPREREIMALAAEGMSNREISECLFISEGTVKNHIHRVLHKLGMANRAQAAAHLVRHGLVTEGTPEEA